MAQKRRRHPKKDLEALLRDAEHAGWTVTRKNGYYKAMCPCGDHRESVHLSPSNPNYGRNKRNKMRKCGNWEEK